jgi:group I intron endonuclease
MLFNQDSIINSRGQYKNPIVYGLCDPDTLELRYVGKALNGSGRCFDHGRPSSFKEGKTPKNNWLRKLKAQGKNVVCVLISEYSEDVSNEDLYESEQFFIALYKELNCNLLNLTDGGPGMSGHKFSQESRQKMSLKAKARGCDWLIEYNKNNPRPKKPKKPRRSRAIQGALELYKRSLGQKIVIVNSNNEEIMGFFSKRDAAKFIGDKCNKSGISLAIKNNQEYYGYFWRII